MPTFFTIGHSTRSAGELIQILESSEIGVVVDVRAIPRSRTSSRPTRPARAVPRRGRQHLFPASPNTFWENQSFRNFADYAMTESFHDGLIRLQQIGAAKRCAIMCSELLWWRCHRRIIADYLILAGHTVIHIFDRAKQEQARLTPAAQPAGHDKIVYAAPSTGTGDLFT